MIHLYIKENICEEYADIIAERKRVRALINELEK